MMVMMMLADIRDIDVRRPGLLCLLVILIPRLLAGSVILLVLVASVGAVRGLEMIIFRVGGPVVTLNEDGD